MEFFVCLAWIMIQEYVSVDGADPAWDEFLANTAGGHHEQSSLYARQRQRFGFRCYRITISENKEIVGGAQVLVRKVPAFGRVATILRAPVVSAGRDDVTVIILEALQRLSAREGLGLVSVYCFPGQDKTLSILERFGFEPNGCWFEGDAVGVSLVETEEEILARMKPKGRYNIHLAGRKGVVVEEGDARRIQTFFDLHKSTAGYQGFPIFPLEYFCHLWEVFGRREKLPTFIAFHEGVPVAAIMNTIVDDRVYYGWGGMSRDPRHRKLMANYLIHWTAMKWAKGRGCSQYEFMGPNEFKAKLGTVNHSWPSPRRRFPGRYPQIRKMLFERAWRNRRLRRTVDNLHYRLFNPMLY